MPPESALEYELTVEASLRTQKTAKAVAIIFTGERQGEGFVWVASDAVQMEERERSNRHAACGRIILAFDDLLLRFRRELLISHYPQ